MSGHVMQPVEKSSRIEVVDALRGFAVLAIVLLHNLEHFIFPVYPTDTPQWLEVLDQGVFHGGFALFAGKANAIFALLFGFTFYIQCRNRSRVGKDFGYRFLWRLLLLAVFATLNAAFFPAGDILLLFSIVGILLFFARNWSDRAVMAAAVVLLLQPVEWYHYIAGSVSPSYRMPDLNVDAMYARVAECAKAGHFGDFVLCNVTLGQKASLLWALQVGRFSQVAGLFLLGFYIGRKRFFVSSEKNLRFWVKVLIVSAVAYAPLGAFRELLMTNDDPVIRQTVATVCDMWQKLAFTSVLVASFVLLYRSDRFRRAVGSLRSYGKMSLTNYITQSVIGAFVYFPFGLYLAPYCGYTVSLLIGFFTFWLQVRFCTWWLGRHRQGPLEYIWHKWTWMGTGR